MVDIDDSQIMSVGALIKGLFEHVHIGTLPDDAPYRGLLALGKSYALDEQGYEKWYRGLMTATFALPRVGEIWSEDGIVVEYGKEKAS